MIFEIEITDQDAWVDYQKAAGPMMKAAGGRFLISSQTIEPLEGGWNPSSLSVVEFPSFEAAHAFYHSDAYKEMIALRQRASRGRGILVGANPPGEPNAS